MDCPALAQVPMNHRQMPKIKATISGITYLKNDGEYRTRYTGNKFSAVDINGNLWLKSSDLKKQKEIEYWRMKGKSVPKKKARVETQAGNNKICINEPVQISNNLSTQQNQYPIDLRELSTTTPQKKFYTVNKKEVRQRLLGFINTQRGKKELYFWTVTFPMGTPDSVCYKIFNIWLTSLRQYKMLKNYLWVAERQGEHSKIGNTTLHFHIAIPHKMPVQRANAMMRGTLKTFSSRGEIPFSVHQCRRYNGVDIAKHRTTRRVTNFAIKKGAKSLTVYLTKYVTKNDTAFEHLAWHNSRGYSSIFTGVTFTIEEFYKLKFDQVLHRDSRKWFDCEYFTFIPWYNGPPVLLENHLFLLNSFLQEQLELINN